MYACMYAMLCYAMLCHIYPYFKHKLCPHYYASARSLAIPVDIDATRSVTTIWFLFLIIYSF